MAASAVTHTKCTLVRQLSMPAPPRPPSDPVLVFPCIAVPAILVKLFAEWFNIAWSRRGLFSSAHEDRSLEAGIEFVTWMGRSKIVYSSVPLRRKFWRMEICHHQLSVHLWSRVQLTLYAPRGELLFDPSPTKQSGHNQLTCFTVLPGSCAMISPRLALFAVAVPFEIVKL